MQEQTEKQPFQSDFMILTVVLVGILWQVGTFHPYISCIGSTVTNTHQSHARLVLKLVGWSTLKQWKIA